MASPASYRLIDGSHSYNSTSPRKTDPITMTPKKKKNEKRPQCQHSPTPSSSLNGQQRVKTLKGNTKSAPQSPDENNRCDETEKTSKTTRPRRKSDSPFLEEEMGIEVKSNSRSGLNTWGPKKCLNSQFSRKQGGSSLPKSGFHESNPKSTPPDGLAVLFSKRQSPANNQSPVSSHSDNQPPVIEVVPGSPLFDDTQEYFVPLCEKEEVMIVEDVKAAPKSPVHAIKEKLKGYKLSPVNFAIFELDEEEPIKVFECWLKCNSYVRVHGTMFVTNNYFCFSSLKADKVKPRDKIIIVIASIESIEKTENTKIHITQKNIEGSKPKMWQFGGFENINDAAHYLISVWDEKGRGED